MKVSKVNPVTKQEEEVEFDTEKAYRKDKDQDFLWTPKGEYTPEMIAELARMDSHIERMKKFSA